MVRKLVLLALIVAAALLAVVGFALVVVPALEVPCPEPEECGGLGSSPAPNPGSGGCGEESACVCMSVLCAYVDAVCIGFGVLTGIATCLCYTWFADEEEEAAGAAEKAGYVAIAGGDIEVAAGTGAGGKN